MAERKIKRALISVYDKTGIVDFARALVDEFGIEIISTGGTAKLLNENGIPVTLVEAITGFPEMLDGRVKTLHPKIFAAILADRDNPEHMRQLEAQGIEPIDMVVVNLYPFEQTVADPNCTFQQAIEMIDIGGPSLLRAAAKNHKHVIPVALKRTLDYVLGELRESSDVSETGRVCIASVAFECTAAYDARIETYLTNRWTDLRVQRNSVNLPFLYSKKEVPETEIIPATLELILANIKGFRYGENPHQSSILARMLAASREPNLVDATIPGELISYNNANDAHCALELCKEVARLHKVCGTGLETGTTHQATCSPPVCAFIKHTNACGVGVAGDPIEAYRSAYLGDPNAAMGGVLACSFPIDATFAKAVMATYQNWGKSVGAGGFFVEVWIAPSFDDDAVAVIRTTKDWGKRVRLLAVGDMTQPPDDKALEYKGITGGMLVQTRDLVGLNEDQWKVVTKRAPTDREMDDLRLAWLIAKHTKSNAISICKDGMLIGNGAGQMSRVMSCRIATWLAKENRHEDKLKGSSAASDAFFPFRDGPDILMDAGVTAIIQPGGSKRDEETIKACDERGVAMIFTGTRHFRH